jgi:hypothetical protein
MTRWPAALHGGLLWLACGPGLAAPPQTVYRCGPDGRIYSQTPCSDGKAVNTDDARSASQQKAARDVAARDAEMARQLAEERRQRDAAVLGQQPAGFKVAPPPEAASAPARKGKTKAPSAAGSASMSPLMRVPTPAGSGK